MGKLRLVLQLAFRRWIASKLHYPLKIRFVASASFVHYVHVIVVVAYLVKPYTESAIR